MKLYSIKTPAALFVLLAIFLIPITTFAAGPAGVETGLQLWLSADSGAYDAGSELAEDGEEVASWTDQSDIARVASSSSPTDRALYSATGLNFNPTLLFTNDNYTTADTGLPGGSDDRSIFVVASVNSGGWRYVLGAGTFGGNAGFDFGHNAGNQSVFITSHSAQEASTGSWSPYGSARLAYGAVDATALYIAVNGSTPSMGSGGSVNTIKDGELNIGANSGNSEMWDGSISEVIFYDRVVSNIERQRINSYLALKYGFSLDQSTAQSYLASGAALMWDKDATDASTYNNDLFGIGRDDASDLSQIKSKGQNVTTVVTLEAVGEGTNLSPNFTDMADLEFLVVGNDTGSDSWTSTDAPSGYQILDRKWKKQEQGDVGSVNIDFDVEDSDFDIPDTIGGSDYYFIYDTDNDGSLADEVPTPMTDQGGDVWRVTIDFGAGGLFTLGTTGNPALVTLSPVDNATGVAVTTNLAMNFNKTVVAGTGNILIRKVSDDSIVETIPVGSAGVTGGGTATITINPTQNLEGSTQYYIQVASTTFEDGSANYFAGIGNKTAWNFTTAVAAPDPDDEEEEEENEGGSSSSQTKAGARKSAVKPAAPVAITETTTVCEPYLRSYIKLGADNNSDDVRKLETFLNEKQGESLIVDGLYDVSDAEAVKRFQQKYASEVLGVWGLFEPTGYVYRTTLMKINSFYCSQSLQCPVFTEFNSMTENVVSDEVLRTKVLLGELGFYTGVQDTIFDVGLQRSLIDFQETFSDTMLKPWGLLAGTGYKYKTTNKFLNLIVGCKTAAVELDGNGTFDY